MNNKKFSAAFQSKTIASLLLDKSFLIQIHDILKPSIFDDKAREYILTEILDYYKKYKDTPSPDALTNIVNKIEDDNLSKLVIHELNNVISYSASKDLQFVKDEIVSFCRDQEMKQAIYKSVDLVKAERYDEIRKVIDQALKAGQSYNIGHDYFNEIDDRYLNSVRDVIPTPWDVMNELLDGGVGKGELITFVGNPGSGKSWVLVNMGHSALIKGKRVVHYTLELNQNYTGLRYDSKFTGIPFQDLKYHLPDVKEKLKRYTNNNLIIKDYPTKSISVEGLRAHLHTLIINDMGPDMVVLDYADLLKGNGNLKKHESVEEIYEQLRGLAGELKIPIVTASQAGRSGESGDHVEATSIADSYAKVMIADIVISLSRKAEDKVNGTGRFHFIKNRFGADGITLPSKINMAIGDIQVYSGESESGMELRKGMGENGEKKLLAQKYKELQVSIQKPNVNY